MNAKTTKSLVKCILFFIGIFSTVSALPSVYLMPTKGNSIVGSTFTIKVEPKDTETSVRERYEVSENEIIEANPSVNFSNLKRGTTLIIPKQHILPPYHKGIVINMAELRVYYFTSDGKYVFTFPVGMGRPNWRTPTTITTVVKKESNPIWRVPDSIQAYTWIKHGIWLPDIVPPGPKNPLGKYALYLKRNGYLIHGTNQPETVGTFASSGCMRLNSDAIETLYEDVEINTPVYIIHHANKVGWLNNELYLESHVPIRLTETPSILNDMDIADALKEARRLHPIIDINWNAVNTVVREHDGIPHIIGKVSFITQQTVSLPE